jgi:hypothetical protein
VSERAAETGRVSYNGVRSLPPRTLEPAGLPVIEPQVVHMRPGPGGWMLADYEWDPETGEAKLTYERTNLVTGAREERYALRKQPHARHHTGWLWRHTL